MAVDENGEAKQAEDCTSWHCTHGKLVVTNDAKILKLQATKGAMVPNGFSYGRLRLTRIQKVKQHFELQFGEEATNQTTP